MEKKTNIVAVASLFAVPSTLFPAANYSAYMKKS